MEAGVEWFQPEKWEYLDYIEFLIIVINSNKI